MTATIVGKEKKNDVLQGTSGDDVIVGLSGNDQIFGNGGYDHICGGMVTTRSMVAAVYDGIFGEDGNDYLGPW